MNLEDVTYDAFISYRHCELDKFVAENLHKQLESFKIPKSLLTSGKTNGRSKIERVFRDRDELPLASNLADPITTALKKSDYLIVICSPRLPESKWCLKEIETFIEMHGRDHILAVLIEGEPIDSFPDILRFEEKTLTDTNGNTYTEQIEVEPLAADVRGKNKKEVLKQIKSELLRLVAPMLNCNYDDLKMRHKEARQKKILRVSLGVSLICLIFTAISTVMALTIHKQSNTINEQYTKALETHAISYASISQTLLIEEDRMAAMAIARTVLPDSMTEQENKPYTPDAEYALSDSLGIYNNGRTNYAVKNLEQTSPINTMLVSPDEDTITTVDTNNQITIYDIASGETLCSYTMPEDYKSVLDKTSIAYLNNNQLVYIAFNGFCIYDIPSQKETFFSTGKPASYLRCSSDGSYFALSGFYGLQIYDNSGNSIYTHDWPNGYRGDNAMCFYADKQLFAFSSCPIKNNTPNGIIGLLDLNTLKIRYTKKVNISSFKQISFLNDQLLFAGIATYSLSDNLLDYKSDVHIYSFPFNKDKENWEYTKENSSIDFFTGTMEWTSQTIAYANGNNIEFINAEDGSYISSQNTETPVLEMVPLTTDGYVTAVTEDGKKLIINNSTSLLSTTLLEEYNTNNGIFTDYIITNTFDAAYRRNATAITIYQKISSDKAENLTSFDKFISHAVYSEKQKAFLMYDVDNILYLYNISDKSLNTINGEETIQNTFFTGDDQEYFAVLYKNKLTFYDTKTGEEKNTTSLTNVLDIDDITKIHLMDISSDGSKIAFYDSYNNHICIYSIEEQTLKTMPMADSHTNMHLTGDFTKCAFTSVKDNKLILYDMATEKQLQETDINASLVTNVLLSSEANCIIVTYLDNSVILYSMDDLSILHTYTNFVTNVTNFETLNIKSSEGDSPAPVYALYGTLDCYLLNSKFEPVAHLYEYRAFDSEKQQFLLSCKKDLIAVPYYTYDMLIEEADKQLANYKLSNYRKNQLGIR